MKKFITVMPAILLILFATVTTHATQIKDLNVDVRGLAQFAYSWDQEDGDDQLDVTRLRVNFTTHATKYISMYADIEATNNISGSGAAGGRNSITEGSADSRIVDIYADFYYWKKVTMRVGQFPLPNSYELNTPEYELETIQYSMGIGDFSRRDRGFIFFGDPTKEFSWAAWMVNGSGGITGADSDSDDRSDFGLQLDYFPAEVFSIKLWGSWGEVAADTSSQDSDTDAYGFGLDYVMNNFHLFGEFNDEDTNTGGMKRADTQEWYIHASHFIPQTPLQFVVRYDEYTQDVLGVNAIDEKITTVGINWDFESNSRLQVMRDFVNGPDNDKLDIQLSIRF